MYLSALIFFLLYNNCCYLEAQTLRNNDSLLIAIDTIITIEDNVRLPFTVDNVGNLYVLKRNGDLTNFSNNNVLNNFYFKKVKEFYVNNDYYIFVYASDYTKTDSVVYYDKKFIKKKSVNSISKIDSNFIEYSCPFFSQFLMANIGKKPSEILCYNYDCETKEILNVYLYDVHLSNKINYSTNHLVINSPDGYYYSICDTDSTMIIRKMDSAFFNVNSVDLNVLNREIEYVLAIINNRVFYTVPITGNIYMANLNFIDGSFSNETQITDLMMIDKEQFYIINGKVIIYAWIDRYDGVDLETAKVFKSLIKISLSN